MSRHLEERQELERQLCFWEAETLKLCERSRRADAMLRWAGQVARARQRLDEATFRLLALLTPERAAGAQAKGWGCLDLASPPARTTSWTSSMLPLAGLPARAASAAPAASAASATPPRVLPQSQLALGRRGLAGLVLGLPKACAAKPDASASRLRRVQVPLTKEKPPKKSPARQRVWTARKGLQAIDQVFVELLEEDRGAALRRELQKVIVALGPMEQLAQELVDEPGDVNDPDAVVAKTDALGRQLRLSVAWSNEADDCWNWSCNVQELDEARNCFLDAVDILLDLEAERKVRSIRDRVAFLGKALKTAPGGAGASAEFVVVTRPTELDADEAQRLVHELKGQGICCRRLVVNQIIEPESGEPYWKARVEAQGKVMDKLRQVCNEWKVPLFEVGDRPENLVGPPALGYLASLAFGDGALPSTQVTLFGGKGGVGKTSMSSAMAVKTAMEGQKVLIISTDPAHSLGDALGCELSAKAQPVEGFAGAGELYAMEVDTAAAMQRFQDTVRDALQQRQGDGGIVGQVLKQLPMQDFIDLFNTLPPGSDEIVALTEVLEKVKENFDRIIIDTAPTGHAVRLLSYPDFLERLAERVARLRERFGWLSGSKGPDQVRSFQFRMIELQELFTDPERSSFCVVTIPTNLALEETKRLLKQLEEQDINCGLVIANRILDMDQVSQAAASQQKTQEAALALLDALAKKEGLEVVRVPYMDRELQGIYGLQYLGQSLVEA
ncbi:unnamed protein product [Effrenium voratum]|nr:unnamed protein product [Effrenium voratum]